jgi:prolyl-tRNA synthetase
VKNDTKATTRCIPLDQSAHSGPGTCIVCGKPATQWVIFARAY